MISLLGMPALQYEENDSYLTVLADVFSFVICNSAIYVTSCKYIVERVVNEAILYVSSRLFALSSYE